MQKPREQERGEGRGEDKSISRTARRVADRAHRKRCEDRRKTSKEQEHAGAGAVFRFWKATDAFGIDSRINDRHEQSGEG